MVWIIVLVVVGAWALTALGYLSIWVALLATLGVALLGAWNLDRVPGRGRRAVRDENRPELFVPMANQTWQVPTSYIDHKTGSGAPPGVEAYDEDHVDRLIGDHGDQLDSPPDERRSPR